MPEFKKGDKVIFIRYGGGLSFYEGYVYTFYGWYDSEVATKYSSFVKMFPERAYDDDYTKKRYCQFAELIESGNLGHNASAYDLELFDPKKHTAFVMVDQEVLKNDMSKFISDYGE